jgi:hypothetical protein
MHFTRLLSWLRLVFPPLYVVLAVVFSLLPFDFFVWQFRVKLNQPVPVELVQPRDVLALVICIALGVLRVVRFHPFHQPSYCQWLRTTPWRSGQPLPGGPIHLVVQDALPLLLIYLLLPEFSFHPIYLPVAYIVGWLLPIIIFLRVAGLWFATYSIAFLLAFVAYSILNVPAALGLLLLTYCISLWGLSVSWNRSWEPVDPRRSITASSLSDFRSTPGSIEQRLECGWPFDALSPKMPVQRVRRVDGVLLSLVVGCWIFVVVSHIQQPVQRWEFATFLVSVALVLAPVRVVIYLYRCRAPINLSGRIARHFGVIPTYDLVFLAPVCVLAVGMIGLERLAQRPALPELVAGSTIAAMLFVALNMGPSLARWTLTGNHRLRQGYLDQQKFGKV